MICTLQPFHDHSRNPELLLFKTHAAFAPYASKSRVSEEVDSDNDNKLGCIINSPQFNTNGRLIAFRETVRQRQDRLEFLRRQDAARRRMSREKMSSEVMGNLSFTGSMLASSSKVKSTKVFEDQLDQAGTSSNAYGTSNYLQGFDYNNEVSYSSDDSGSDSDSDSELDFDSLDWPDQDHDAPVKIQGPTTPFLQSEISFSPKETFVQSPKRELYTLSEDVIGEENEEEDDDCYDTGRLAALSQIYSQFQRSDRERRRRWSWPMAYDHDRRKLSRSPGLESIPEHGELHF